METEQEQFISGAELDVRSESEKIKDFKFEEIVASANPVKWEEKTPDQWRKFPIFNQDSSGSCVAQTEAKEMGIMRWLKDGNYVHFSATHIYSRRSNKPAAGMVADDARKIATNGVTLEVLAPSQNMTDKQMDDLLIEPYKQQVGDVFKVPNYISLTPKDIDAVASVIQTTGKGVMLWFFFQYKEWTDHPTITDPSLTLISPSVVRHSVTGVDFALVNGKKSIIIEDSWGPQFGLNGQRVIDEDFFKERNWYANYLVNFKFDDQTQPQPIPPPIPHYVFTKDLSFGMTDKDIVRLQEILLYEGLFPSNASLTGFYGAITAKGVLAWQKKHGVAPVAELDALGGRVVGPKTRRFLNSIYGQ